MNKKLLGIAALAAIGTIAALGLVIVMRSKIATSSHNNNDVIFAKMMIPHHEQAIEMATLAATQAGSQDVKDLAKAIYGAQDPEITMMKGWLTNWKESTTIAASNMDGMNGHTMETSAPAMMMDSDMNLLKAATGVAFDKQFLTMMIAHHQGAIMMAKSERLTGKYAPALNLAKSIIDGQAAQIQTMQKLLKG